MRLKPQPKRRTQSTTICHGCIPRSSDRERRNEWAGRWVDGVEWHAGIRELMEEALGEDVYKAPSYEEMWNLKWHEIMLEKGREDVNVLCPCIYQALQWVDAYCGRNHGVTEGKYQLQCQNVLSETLEGQNCKMVSKLWYFYCHPADSFPRHKWYISALTVRLLYHN